MKIDIVYDPIPPDQVDQFMANAFGGKQPNYQSQPAPSNYAPQPNYNYATQSSSQDSSYQQPQPKAPSTVMEGGFPVQEIPHVEENIKKLNDNGYVFQEIVPDPKHDYYYPMGIEDYGKDGFFNHMHLDYEGGDDGESYFTGPDSDVTFLDIIQPMSLGGHD